MQKIRVTIWNEYIHEKSDPAVARIYPEGIHEAIAEYLRGKEDLEIGVATLEEPEHGLIEDRLKSTDVLIWWGHRAHDRVSDEVVDRVHRRVVFEGMGLIILHSAHLSKIFRRLMGTSCRLKWREAGERERVWVVAPWHPIADGLGEYFEIEHSEMYGEPFDIPPPDQLVFISWFKGGEVFRSGCCFHRGMGRIFYFSPGHETYPIYYNPSVRRVIYNAILWAKPVRRAPPVFGRVDPLEKL
ncbi:MAG: ThuA domain-containing protein [Candidatus Bathyarchaeota archaeon]|nr:ThuA domain-containing protein [Candidatus Bathyarchaeota archaeon]